MELDEIRKEIDGVDAGIVHLLRNRMELAAMVAEYKKDNGLPVLDAARERVKMDSVAAAAGEEYGDYAREVYGTVMKVSRSLQKSRTGVFGLLGGRLGHSYSPQIHKMFGGYDYALFERAPEELDEFFRDAAFDGINVTIPYKKAVIPYCAELSDAAGRIGSVNTIVKLPDGRLRGDNTDYCGFQYLVRSTGISAAGKKCLVLGDGGVAPTVRTALSDLGAGSVVTISRRGEDNYENISRHYDADIIVNTTPVGMYPNNGTAAVDITKFKHLSGVLDVVYNPNRTKLILDAERLGIPCSGGLLMLVYQAKRACEIFTDRVIPDERADETAAVIARQMKNIALIGMPGCGKTSAGRELAKLTGREFADMDAEIVKRIGCSIPEFFAAHGEEAFRKTETEVLAEFSKRSGMIIATGGGVVTRSENRDLLRQNSTVVFLNRTDIDSLAKNGRPISQAKSAQTLSEERMPMYRGWSDFTVECENPLANAKKIAEALEE